MLASRDAAAAARRPAGRPAPGVAFDGRALALAGGGALQALRSPSYAAVCEVTLSDVDFRHVVAAMPALEALQRLTRLALHRTRVASLPALDTLLRLPRLRELEVGGSPVNRCALLRPYVAHRQ
ncbi:hypothetical protein MNEG_12939 [Monoraphidium neglectum]|uniref:Uncharacterized protein n=1 Tax=Monoraphidium neglectum TaxID=145388 RepID=A0A0D2KGT0_9CHLO|nr:hypothetical protein MNEG_12939 [Monoraphidium neglectum]KIY95023.1 hypothetical protein MNEG_12939 [Monoraphidium neglectum]|eukprot:XP_013894043.1 hypothetical protein MNEG_12939 [Monoraphidium neglectum]